MNHAPTIIAVCIQARVPAIVTGEPGVGKSKSTEATCAALGLPCEVFILSQREPTDIGGVPMRSPEGLVWECGPEIRRLAAVPRGVLFLDELSLAPPAVQAPALRLLAEGRINDYDLRHIAFVAAANPPDMCSGWDLTPPLANRLLHCEWSNDPKLWVQGQLTGWPTPRVPLLPRGWDELVSAHRAIVASYIEHRPQCLHQRPADLGKASGPWPSNRTWSMTERIAAACEAAALDEDVTLLSIAGCIGHGAALEYLQWRRDLDLPDPEAVLADPKSFKLPKRGDQQFAALAAIAAAVIRHLTPERWQACWRILNAVAKAGAVDVGAASVRAILVAAEGRIYKDLPPPVDEVRAYMPLLKAAGLMR